MAIYTVELDGKQFDIEGPEGATEDELYGAATEHQKANPAPAQPSAMDTALQNSGPLGTLGKMGMDAMGAISDGFNKAGEFTAESLAGGVASRKPEEIGMVERMAGAAGLPISPIRQAKPGEESFKTSPEVAALAGTAVSMVPDIATSLPMGGGAAVGAKVAGNAVKASKAGKFVQRVGKALKGPTAEEAKIAASEMRLNFRPKAAEKAREVGQFDIRQAEDMLTAAKKEAMEVLTSVKDKGRPMTEAARTEAQAKLKGMADNIRKMRESLIELPGTTRAKLAELEQLKSEAGKAMGAAEDASGFGFKTSPKFEERIKSPKFTSRVAEKLRPMFNKGPEEVAARLKPKNIQKVRKIMQEESGLSNIGHAEGQSMRETAAQALSLKSKPFAEARSRFHDVTNALDNLPNEMKAKSEALRKALGEARDGFKEAAAEAKQKIGSVRNTEEKALADTVASRKREVKTKIIDSATRLQKAKQEAQDLMAQAKSADAAELADIKLKAHALVQEGLENNVIMRKLKGIGGAVAGAAGLGTISAMLKGGK